MNKTYYSLSVSGLNLHHVVEYFEREHFHVQNLSRTDKNTLFVTLSKSEYHKFIAENFAKTFQIKVVKIEGAQKTTSSFLRHIGLFLGIVISLFSVCFCTNRIFSVEINQTAHTCKNQEQCIFSESNKKALLEKLASLGIAKGKSNHIKLSNREIEHVLMQEFKQISGVTIKQKGVKVYITIQEATLPEGEHVSSLVSPVSGVVVTNNVVSGIAKVKNGDIVLKGQTLAVPEDGKTVSATFEIRTFYHETMIYSENVISYVKTGKKKTRNSIEIFGLKLKNNKKCPFALYESTKIKRYAFYNLFLPIVCTSETFEEIEKQETTVPFQEVENALKQKLYLQTKALLPLGVQEKNTTFATFQEKDKTRLDCYIEAIIKVESEI